MLGQSVNLNLDSCSRYLLLYDKPPQTQCLKPSFYLIHNFAGEEFRKGSAGWFIFASLPSWLHHTHDKASALLDLSLQVMSYPPRLPRMVWASHSGSLPVQVRGRTLNLLGKLRDMLGTKTVSLLLDFIGQRT